MHGLGVHGRARARESMEEGVRGRGGEEGGRDFSVGADGKPQHTPFRAGVEAGVPLLRSLAGPHDIPELSLQRTPQSSHFSDVTLTRSQPW